MAGIIVSGGTYSGSGDVTAEYFQTKSTGWDVTLTSGVMELYGELSSGETLLNNWGGDANAWKHNDGTVKFTHNGTRVNAIGVTPSAGAFYNVIVNGNVDGRGVNGVQFITAASGSHLKIANNLTVTSGAAWTTQTAGQADFLLEVIGHCLVTQSGATLFGDASFMDGGYNATRHGLVKVGSLQVNENGYFSATSGTTGILGVPNGGYSMYIPNGGFYHSSGTVDVRFTGTDATQVRNQDPFYNYEQTLDTGAYASARVNWRGDGSAPYQFTIANNLTIREGAFRPVNAAYSIVVSGNVDVEAGGTYGYSAGDFEAAASFGSVYNLLGTMYLSTGTTTITGPHTSGYLWRTNAGTFYHNNGLVYITTGAYNGADVYPASTQHFYDLTYSGSGTVEMFGCTIDNDFDVGTDIIFRPITPTQAFTVSGTATMNGFFGKDGYPQTVDNTFGALNIKSGGTYYATSGTTTVGSNAIPAIFDNNGTFTHNSGTVTLEYGAGGDTVVTGSSRTTFNKLNTGFSYMKTGFVVEDTWATTGDGGGATTFYKSSQNWVLGTTSSTGYLVTNVGTGIQAGDNTTISGASEAYPAIVSGTKYDFHTTINTLNNVDFTDAQTSDANATLVLSNVDFSSGLTTNDGTAQIVTFNSGTWVKFGGSFLPGDDTKEIVSGATVIFDGTGNYSQDNLATVYGRGDATLWWESTGNYSPNGTFTSTGFRDVFWNSDSRINQDAVFRGSNLIVGKQFSSQNRAIGTSGAPPKIIIANGGTVSSSTGVFHASSFSNRGGLFVSSSALGLDGTEYATMGDGMATATAVTLESWVKPSEAPYENTMIGTDSSKGGILSSNTLNKIRIKHESVDTGYTDVDYNWVVDKWVNICFTWDGSTGKVYADGKLLHTFALSGSPYNLTKACIGSLRENGDWPWEGNIGRTSIWKAALTSAEVREMMFYDWTTVAASSIDQTDCVGWYQFDEGEGASISDMSGSGNTATITGSTPWANAGTWTGGNKLGSETGVVAGNLYIGNGGVTPTVFGSSYFPLANRRLISGSKFASKSHLGTTEYYIATSGTNDWLNYQKLEEVATIGALNDLKVLADGSNRSYFNFDSNANNEQCNTFVNAGYIRIVDNADFYTQDFDNSQGIWERGPSYDGIIHDDGSTPHEYEPIDLMDDQDSNFDTSELID